MRQVSRAWVNHDVAAVGVAHQVTVGAGARHHAGVGGGQTLHIFQQGHGLLGLPVQGVHDLAVGTGQSQLAKRRFVLHVAGFFASQPTCARAACPQGLVGDGAGIEHLLYKLVGLQSFKRANGWKDDEKFPGLVPRQGLFWADPNRFKLLRLVGHGGLVWRHAGDQKRHIKAPRQIAVCAPVGQHKNFVGGQ